MSKSKRPCVYIVRDFLLAFEGSTPEQNVVLLTLAAFADPDGSHIFPGTRALTRLTGLKRGTKGKLQAAIDYWITLRILLLVSEAHSTKADEYRIDLECIAHFLDAVPTGGPHNNNPMKPDAVPPSGPHGEQEIQPDAVPVRSRCGPDAVPKAQNAVPTVGQQVLTSRVKAREEEEQEDALRAKVTAAAAEINSAFELFNNHDEPFGDFACQLQWLHTVQTNRDPLPSHDSGHYSYTNMMFAIERCIQSCMRKRIDIPPPLYYEKRFAETYKDMDRG
jgi:hypothetical protein